jgi:HD superfamily phosphodiesterase
MMVANTPNYRLEHIRQVERHALRLFAQPGGDPEIWLAPVWIHDRCQPQFSSQDHAAQAAGWASENLASYGFPDEKQEIEGL